MKTEVKTEMEDVMSTTLPIRDLKEIRCLKDYYLTTQPNLRNYALISTGINTALRVSDLLSMKWEDVYNFQMQTFRRHIILTEKKTGKESRIAINHSLKCDLSLYMKSLPAISPKDYIFYGRLPDTHLSRSQAFRIVKQAGSTIPLSEHISCHSLRKTFGYHAWTAGVDPTMLMVIFNHSSFTITKRYLGIEQEDKDRIFLNLNL
jgi:integrase